MAVETLIQGNRFIENEGHIGRTGAVAVVDRSWILDNYFATGGIQAPTIYLDLRTGTVGKNVVTGNFFGGTYTQVGGYHPNGTGADAWQGNMCEDVASASCGDNGWSVVAPA